MHCPSCGKEIPVNSTFCLYCGSAVSTTELPTEWEYRDFVYTWSVEHRPWARISYIGDYDIPSARLWFWQEYQHTILPELQKWRDEGWQPISEVGPSGIELHAYKSRRQASFWDWVMDLTYLELPPADSYVEPTEFRVAMRRRLPQTE